MTSGLVCGTAHGYTSAPMTPRDLRLAWEQDTQRLLLLCHPGDPPHWPNPRGSDPLGLLDVQQANRALAYGLSVRSAAETLAARHLARTHGANAVRVAVLIRSPDRRVPPTGPLRRGRPLLLQGVPAWA